MTRKHFTTEQVAEMFATDADKVRRWIRLGRLEAVNVGTAARPMYRISEAELERFESVNTSGRAA